MVLTADAPRETTTAIREPPLDFAKTRTVYWYSIKSKTAIQQITTEVRDRVLQKVEA
jgi:hypothetical protein